MNSPTGRSRSRQENFLQNSELLLAQPIPMSSVRSTYGLSNNQLKGLKHSNKKNTTSGNLGAYLGKDPYSSDLRAARDKEFREIKRDI